MASESAFLTDCAERIRGMSDRVSLGDEAQSPSCAVKRLTMPVKQGRLIHMRVAWQGDAGEVVGDSTVTREPIGP